MSKEKQKGLLLEILDEYLDLPPGLCDVILGFLETRKRTETIAHAWALWKFPVIDTIPGDMIYRACINRYEYEFFIGQERNCITVKRKGTPSVSFFLEPEKETTDKNFKLYFTEECTAVAIGEYLAILRVCFYDVKFKLSFFSFWHQK